MTESTGPVDRNEARPLAGRRALITGAARRTGACIAIELAGAGADVVIHYQHSQQQAEQTAVSCRELGVDAVTVSADLSQPQAAAEQIDEQIGRTGLPVNILVNNVGNYPVGGPLQLPTAEFADLLGTNLLAPYALIRQLAPMLGGGAEADIINIGYSGVEHTVANRHAMAYQISKAGLLIMTRTLAQELGPQGVRVNMVSPGQLENSVDLPTDINQQIPLGYAGAEEEIASAIIYLLGEGRYISGANIDVGGGYRLGLARRLEDD